MLHSITKRLLAFLTMITLCIGLLPTNVNAAPSKYVKSFSMQKSNGSTLKSNATLKLDKGKKASVKVTVKVKGKASKNVTVSSSNKKIATVKVGKPNSKGVSTVTITGKKKGNATITIKTKGKGKNNKIISKKLKVKVQTPKANEDGYVKSIKIVDKNGKEVTSLDMYEGEEVELYAQVDRTNDSISNHVHVVVMKDIIDATTVPITRVTGKLTAKERNYNKDSNGQYKKSPCITIKATKSGLAAVLIIANEETNTFDSASSQIVVNIRKWKAGDDALGRPINNTYGEVDKWWRELDIKGRTYQNFEHYNSFQANPLPCIPFEELTANELTYIHGLYDVGGYIEKRYHTGDFVARLMPTGNPDNPYAYPYWRMYSVIRTPESGGKGLLDKYKDMTYVIVKNDGLGSPIDFARWDTDKYAHCENCGLYGYYMDINSHCASRPECKDSFKVEDLIDEETAPIEVIRAIDSGEYYIHH